MTGLSRRQAAMRGFGWGAIAGLAFVALMYLANLVLGLRTLPQLLNQPLLSIMPGFVFGFLIDTLQHAGKVVEEFGLIVAMVGGLGVLGSAWAVANVRWHTQYLALVFAGIGWLVVAAILLPLGGAGFLGLNDGPATPLIWAALFAVYSVVLQLGRDGSGDAGVDLGRRRLLGTLPISIGAISLGVLAFRLLPDWYQAIFNPPEAGLRGPATEITPVDHFFVVSKNFTDPAIDVQGWSLGVGGLVDHPLKLSLTDLRALPAVSEFVTMECISNDVGGGLMSTGSFTGVRLADLIAMAGVQAQGTWVAFTARDGYTESLAVSLVRASPEIIVAYELDGAPLPMSHGFPARMVIPGHYGMKGPKWLDRIDLVNHESGGYWEQQGWDRNAIIKTTSRIDMPKDGDVVKLGPVSIAGVAFAGTRGVSNVEYSTDGGASWSSAPFRAPLSPLTWVLWTADWTPPKEGAYRLMVRATDGMGSPQDQRTAASYPSGASGYHTIQVDVSR
ncbi:MAG: molybdopterin-dependent oxidoreductase [Candidatus Dormibacteraceae bacterium]